MIPYNTDAPLYHAPLATLGLIILNTLLFFVVPTSMLEPEVQFNLASDDAPADVVNDSMMDVTITYPANALVLQYGDGIKPWQWLTSIFMHADFFHLLFNMIALWAFGLIVEGKVGSLVFLGIYLGIGVLQSGIEQSLMSFAGVGGSLGASAAIFGILGIAVVWAPRNDFDVLWSFGFFVGTIEIPVMLYGFITFAMEVVGIVLGRFAISSSVLHLMGLGLGIAVGFLWLRRGWVDCEGWDLVAVLYGKEGKHEENTELDNEARDLIRSSLKSRNSAAKLMPPSASVSSPAAHQSAASAQPRPLASSPDPEQFADLLAGFPSQSPPSIGPLADLEKLIEGGNAATACKLLAKLRQSGTAPELPQALQGKLIRDLLTARDYENSIPLMSDHIQRFAQSRISLQLNLAKVLLHLERPQKAIAVLKSVDTSALDELTKIRWQKLAVHAKKMVAEGIVELRE